MSEKIKFECIWGVYGQAYVDELLIEVSIDETEGMPPYSEWEKLEGKRVRITIEEIK